MESTSVLLETGRTNPIDIVEALMANRDWVYDRRADDEMAVEAPGTWCDFGMFFAWSDDLSALHFSCAMDMRVQDSRRSDICELITLLNERLWMGHFSIWLDEGIPMFRHTTRLRGEPGEQPMIEDLVDLSVAECERFYPAFQFVIWGGKSPQDAISSSLLETVGEA